MRRYSVCYIFVVTNKANDMIFIESIQDLKENRDYIINQIKVEGVEDENTLKKVMERMVAYAKYPETIEEKDWDCDDLILACIDDVTNSVGYTDHTSDMHREGARKQLPSSMR